MVPNPYLVNSFHFFDKKFSYKFHVYENLSAGIFATYECGRDGDKQDTVDEFWRVFVGPKAGSYDLRTHVAKTQSCHGLPQSSPRAVLIIILELGAKPCLVVVNDG